jgi:hypothetical protein
MTTTIVTGEATESIMAINERTILRPGSTRAAGNEQAGATMFSSH